VNSRELIVGQGQIAPEDVMPASYGFQPKRCTAQDGQTLRIAGPVKNELLGIRMTQRHWFTKGEKTY
jgi:hypothetical protein